MASLRAAVYLRISQDDEADPSTAPQRQLEDCEAFAKQQGWFIEEVFEDRGKSAYNVKVEREGFQRLVSDISQQRFDVVMSWRLDRLSRSRRSYADLMESIDAGNAFLYTVSDHVDTRTDGGQWQADILATHARMSSRDSSVRIRRKAVEMAEAGKLMGWGSRSFGYAYDAEAHHPYIIPEEAEAIREALGRLLNGETLHSVMADFNARGIIAPMGRAWQLTNFRKMLLAPRLSGELEYTNKEGEKVRGAAQWQGILSPDEARQLALILAPKVQYTGSRQLALLSGSLLCGLCGAPMRSKPRNGTRAFACVKNPDGSGCAGLSRKIEPIEELVTEAVLTAFDGVDISRFLNDRNSPANELLAIIDADDAALKELASDYYSEKLITKDEFIAAREAISTRLEQNRKKLARRNGKTAILDLMDAGSSIREQWASREIGWQRAIIAAVIESVTVKKTSIGSHAFDPEAIEIKWRV